ncbi:MAG: hypothetical protein KDC95_11400 [Planctomycetes bacterium]|nr:hypothetical protein [Planctomycetota bacterium]
MDVLVLESNKRIRDQIVVGLQNFPEFAVDTGEGFGGLNLTRGKAYDFVFIGTNCADDIGMQLAQKLRETDTNTSLILVTTAKKSKSHQQLRTRLDVLSMLYVPIEPADFFRLVARLRRREVSASN